MLEELDKLRQEQESMQVYIEKLERERTAFQGKLLILALTLEL